MKAGHGSDCNSSGSEGWGRSISRSLGPVLATDCNSVLITTLPRKKDSMEGRKEVLEGMDVGLLRQRVLRVQKHQVTLGL